MHYKSLLNEQYIIATTSNVVATRVEFLELLERDLSDHVVCPACEKLHKIERTEIFYNNHSQLKCVLKDREDGKDLYIDPNFRTSVYAMAMKRCEQQRYQESEFLLGKLSVKAILERHPTQSKHVSAELGLELFLVTGSYVKRESASIPCPPT